ncbi:MAG: hypothetical protein K1X53_07120 [Candidatus Sumerlaeaceae bacterium]|nr:hypothetical protein [Candidatus Sumerlaeaceae bacterium]
MKINAIIGSGCLALALALAGCGGGGTQVKEAKKSVQQMVTAAAEAKEPVEADTDETGLGSERYLTVEKRLKLRQDLIREVLSKQAATVDLRNL